MMNDIRWKSLTKLLEQQVSSKFLPGAQLRIATIDKARQQVNTIYEHSTSEYTNDSLFRMYSQTKVLTATAILILLDRKLIASIDDPISNYLPEFLNHKVAVNVSNNNQKMDLKRFNTYFNLNNTSKNISSENLSKTHPNVKIMDMFLNTIVKTGKLDLINENLAHSDMIDEANVIFGGPVGITGLKLHVKGFHKNISNSKVKVENILASDDKVMGWWSFEGIHSGPWLNVTPTNEHCSANVFSYFDLQDGKVSRYHLSLKTMLDGKEITLNTVEHFGPKGKIKTVTRPSKHPIRVSNLLTHTSGIDYKGLLPYDETTDGLNGMDIEEFKKLAYDSNNRKIQNITEWTKRLAEIPATNDPGQYFEYGFGLDIASSLIEKVSGIPFQEFVKHEILDPLEMHDTYFYATDENKSKLVPFYRAKKEKDDELFIVDDGGNNLNKGSPPCQYLKDTHSRIYGGGGGVEQIRGGLVSSINDWTKFAAMLLNKGTWNHKRILSEEMVEYGTSDILEHATYGNSKELYRNSSYCLLGRLSVGGNGITSYGWGGMGGTTFFINPKRNFMFLFMTSRWTDQKMFLIQNDINKEMYKILNQPKTIHFIRHLKCTANVVVENVMKKYNVPHSDIIGVLGGRREDQYPGLRDETWDAMSSDTLFDSPLIDAAIKYGETTLQENVFEKANNVDVIISSSLERAVHTGLLAYPNFKRSIILSDDIREFTGPYLGEKRHLISEIVTKFDKHKLLLDTSLCHEKDNYFILNVEESNASAVKRSIKFANILNDRIENEISVICHGGFTTRIFFNFDEVDKSDSSIVHQIDYVGDRSYLDTFTNGEIKSFHMECVKNNKDGMMMKEHNNNTRFIFRPASSLSLIKDTTTVAVGNVSKL